MGAGSQDQAAPDHSGSYTHTPSFGSSHSSAPNAPPVEAILLPNSPAPWNLQGAGEAPSFGTSASFTPTPSFTSSHSADAASLQAAADISQEFDGRAARVENLHVHFHTQYPVGAIREEYLKHVRTNSTIIWPGAASNHSGDGSSEPSFTLASCAEGINFGHKFIKGFYRAVKHVDEHRHLITYTQSPSTAQSLSLILSLGLSTKRAKHAIFLFDSGPPQHLAHAWPLHIHLREIASLIQSLGASFEYTQAKVKKNRFSLYIFGIKQRGVRFSSESMKTWGAISYWAHNLPDSTDNAALSSFLSSLGSSQGGSF